MDIETTRNGDIFIYRDEIIAGIRWGFGKILPGVEDELKYLRSI